MAKYHTYDKEDNVLVEYEDTEIVDNVTGEIIPACRVTKKIYGGKPFHKVWLEGFLESFEIVQNKQVDIICYIYEHTQASNNIFLGTYKTIAQAVGVSQPTIAAVMKKLQEKNIIKRVQNGAWQINPLIMMKGDNKKQRILVTRYENLTEEDIPKLGDAE